MGTNTFNLLIAEKKANGFRILFQEKYPVKLGQGGIHQHIITEEAFQRGIFQILKIKKAIQKYRAGEVKALATSAIRHASNGREFTEAVFAKTGIKVTTINGLKEADLIYQGVKSALRLGQGNSLIMDIGGGSTEFIIGNRHEILWKNSYKLGVARLLEHHQISDPIKQEEIIRIERHLKRSLKSLFHAVRNHGVEELIGSSGSFDTFADIYFQKKFNTSFPEGRSTFRFPHGAFLRILDEMIHKSKKERKKTPGMIPMRVDMIGVAALFARLVIRELGISKCRLSTYSLKEGALQSIKS
jgi:exopolyphosphatase/guanosine-5'-triphosphate,3'-diphosphate pyrophosphatase